jgi:hypothetical protein
MADAPDDPTRAQDGASRLLARAAVADSRARSRLKAAIDDIFLPADARLDDRQRAAIDATFAALVATIEGELREHGARLLRARGDEPLAVALAEGGTTASRLWQAGLPRDPELMRELIARVRLDLFAELLPDVAQDDPDRPSLLPRLTEHADRVVAASAHAVMVADNRRRTADVGGRTDLPAELHHKLVWWVAAALREPHAGRPDVARLDRALAEAAQRNLAAQDEGERLEAVALRLAAALDPLPDELPALLVEALDDRRMALFVALLAQALGVPFDAAREIVLDVGGERLWLGCRALDLPRETIARIGLRLAEGDARRDLERFADELDHIAAIPADTARAAIAPLRLHPDYRAALDALRGER